MSPLVLALGTMVALLASHAAEAACVISGPQPTEALPTMAVGQDFSFIASPDCATLHFEIRGTTVSKIPKSGGPVGPGPHTYEVLLSDAEWDAVVAEIGPTLTWVVTGKTSAGVTTRLATTNHLKHDVTIDLSMADATLVGEAVDTDAGISVSGAGDVDGDGHDDLLIGSLQEVGAAYLVLGPVTGTLDLAFADAKLVGEEAEDLAGLAVSGAGDVDGDGHDDLLVGAAFNGEGGDKAGAAYLVLGPVTGTVGLASADAKLIGEATNDIAGSQDGVAGVGDVDGNGHDDLLIGSANNDGGTGAGVAYLVLGPVTGSLDLSLADAKLLAEGSNSATFCTVSGAGDVDGDGRRDLLVGAAYDHAGGLDSGAAYLVLGPVTGTVQLSAADATLVGEESRDWAGMGVSGAGDVDDDGHDDLLVGATKNDEGGKYAGAAYLVLGPVSGTLDLAFADAKLVGEHPHDYVFHVSGAGDVDADGHDDVLVGSYYNDEGGQNAGAAYLELGPFTGTIDLSRADVKLVGEGEYDEAGMGVSGAGDVDGDGRADVLVGAPWAPGGDDVGAAYLLYGKSL